MVEKFVDLAGQRALIDRQNKRNREYPRLFRVLWLLAEKESWTKEETAFLGTLEKLAGTLSTDMAIVSEKRKPSALKKAPNPNRAKDIPRRIKVGLTLWISKRTGKSIKTICEEYKLVSENTYGTYQQEGLAYTRSDIIALSTTWWTLYDKLKEGKPVLDEFIGHLILEKPEY